MPSKGDLQMNRHGCFVSMLAVVATCIASSCSTSHANDEADINQSVQHLVAAVNAKDINGIMAYYTPDESLLVFDALPPRQYVGAAAYRKNWEGFLAAYPSSLHAEVTEWKTEAAGNLAYGHGIFRASGPDKDGKPLDLTLRVTDVYRRINGKWLVVHEHVSWPVDLATGKADLNSKP
jgi:ketosteroid isomerase-like protein